MKQVTRLIGPRRAAKSAAKEAASYNAIASPSSVKSSPAASSTSASLARVHNYGRVKSSPTGGSSLPSSSSGKIQYAALNRMRKKRVEDGANKLPRKSKWRRLFCWKKRRRQRNYQGYWSSQGAKPRKSLLCCCRWGRKFSRSSYQYDSEDEDDDIDAKVAAYMVEMKQREAVVNRQKEAKAAAEELTRSPVIGQRPADATSSPIQSRASSETWPAQSDEDIDRLVAMHQNRSSLSSLGVRSESMASVYSGAGEGRYGTVVVKGQVEFGMQYNYKLGALEIHVVRCKDLAAVDTKRNRSDPYVKVYLLPDKSKAGKRKTKVKKHTLNPIFDETMRFHTPISSLESRTLWLTVWHSDMFGRNDFLGEVSVNLQGRVFDNPQSQWYLLQERSEPFDEVATYRGDIVVGLKYIPPENLKSSIFSRGSSLTGSSSNLRKFGGSIKSVASKSDRSTKGGQLHVLVKEAKHLSPIKANGTCDAFCKSYLLPDRTRSSKQKTPVVKRTLHPSWNYTFVYEDVSLEDLTERALELTVWDHDRLASNEFVGGIRFSLGTGRSYGRQVEWMDATGKELSLWQNMLDRPNFWVEGSLVLRSSLDGNRASLP
ncbi:synaptotagmin-like protein 4 isoform X6 [Drosophila bipectinata]|uniref:synaptotagmin-like protein 4 isoform X6 n=1 Tax=Drosophila bipectinata TaxID=42026 RepID=UPI001C89B88E|nr:synaptotagmin-like protein 4 isoform X6 [Drosophila bipectinata]